MVMALHHDEGVARRVLGRDVPGLLLAAGAAADFQAAPLAERVERHAAVLAEAAPLRRLDGPGLGPQPAAPGSRGTGARR